jgi:hypothetical protein
MPRTAFCRRGRRYTVNPLTPQVSSDTLNPVVRVRVSIIRRQTVETLAQLTNCAQSILVLGDPRRLVVRDQKSRAFAWDARTLELLAADEDSNDISRLLGIEPYQEPNPFCVETKTGVQVTAEGVKLYVGLPGQSKRAVAAPLPLWIHPSLRPDPLRCPTPVRDNPRWGISGGRGDTRGFQQPALSWAGGIWASGRRKVAERQDGPRVGGEGNP